MKLNIYIRIRYPKMPLEAEPEVCYSVSDSCYKDLTACIAIEHDKCDRTNAERQA